MSNLEYNYPEADSNYSLFIELQRAHRERSYKNKVILFVILTTMLSILFSVLLYLEVSGI